MDHISDTACAYFRLKFRTPGLNALVMTPERSALTGAMRGMQYAFFSTGTTKIRML